MDNMKNEAIEVLRLIDECQYCAVSFEPKTTYEDRRIYLELNIASATKFGAMDEDFKNLVDFLINNDNTTLETGYNNESWYETILEDVWGDYVKVIWNYIS